jgi:outer membrane protein
MQKFSSKLALLILLTWCQASLAEDLVTVYGLALQNDAELMIAESNYLAAVQALPLARSGRKPQISLNASGTTRESDNSETGDNDSETVGYSLNLTQSLYDTEIQGDIDVAEASTAAELARLKAVRQDLILRVAETYFGILAAGDNVEFAYAERTAIARQLEQAQKRFEVGLIAITDVQEAQARFDTAEADAILAENILDNGYYSRLFGQETGTAGR